MNLLQKMLFNLASPASIKQAAYKNRAKDANLLHFCDFSTMSLSDKQDLAKNWDKNTKLTVEMPINLSTVDLESYKLSGEKVEIFSSKNFHKGLINCDEDMNFLLDTFNSNLELEPANAVINCNHSHFAEDAIGSFKNLSGVNDDGVIRLFCDPEVTETWNRKWQDQLDAVKKDPDNLELGWSVELTGDALEIIVNADGDETVRIIRPQLIGLATTLTPSAPSTLSTQAEEPKTVNVVQANLAVVENEDNSIEIYDKVLDSENQQWVVVDIITDTSFKYKEVAATDSDPVALLLDTSWSNWATDTMGLHNFENVSKLTKIKDPVVTQLSLAENKKLLSFKLAALNEVEETIPTIETQSETPTVEPKVDEPKLEVKAGVSTTINLTDPVIANLTATIQANLEAKFQANLDEIKEEFDTKIVRAKEDLDSLTTSFLEIVAEQNKTLESNSKSLKSLNNTLQPKTINAF